jgi:phytoene dehydrogenase-like protein
MPAPTPIRRSGKAYVIGSGPNGLAAAIVLAQAGMEVEVFEAEAQPGGGARTMELTLPGFHHDIGSAVHPLAVGAPFFPSLPLADYGLEWIYSPAPLAHPLDDGTAVTLERDLATAEAALGSDGLAWRSLLQPFVTRWPDLTDDILQPIRAWPSHPLLLARFGLTGLQPASFVARRRFRTEPARALFAGLAAHSCLALNQPFTTSFAMVLGVAAHAVGWPIPRGGAQSLTNALVDYFTHALRGRISSNNRIHKLSYLPAYDLILCDVTPRQLLALTGEPSPAQPLSAGYCRQLAKYKYGAAAFKVDFALSRPIPWNASACLRAASVHVGGSLEEIEASEAAMASGQTAARPFVIVAQPTLFDPTRAPEGRHIAWAYCHVPNGSTEDMLDRIESQIERFASGFRNCILARHVSSPATLEAMDANLVGGDIGGGAVNPSQLIFRPTRRHYRTSSPNIYLCSSSTPPGGGVHGMCGANAARIALRDYARS